MKVAATIAFFCLFSLTFCVLFAGIVFPSITVFGIVAVMITVVGGVAFTVFVDDELRQDVVKIVMVAAAFIAMAGLLVASYMIPHIRAVAVGSWSSDQVLRDALDSPDAPVIEAGCQELLSPERPRRESSSMIAAREILSGSQCVQQVADESLQHYLLTQWASRMFDPTGRVSHVAAVKNMGGLFPDLTQNLFLDCAIRSKKEDLRNACKAEITRRPAASIASDTQWWVKRDGAERRFVAAFGGFEGAPVPELTEADSQSAVFQLSCQVLQSNDIRKDAINGRIELRASMMGWLRHKKGFDEKLHHENAIDEVCVQPFDAKKTADEHAAAALADMKREMREIYKDAKVAGKEMKSVGQDIDSAPVETEKTRREKLKNSRNRTVWRHTNPFHQN